MTENNEVASVRYIVDDVPAAIDFYTTHLGFTLNHDASPAFADVVRGPQRVLLSGPTSSGTQQLRDGSTPVPGGWNRIHLIVDNLESEVSRLRDSGVHIRNDIISGPGGQQALVEDPAGNLIELFHPADRR